MSTPKHVFVLMFENRSFDHMLGFSGLGGTDAATGAPTVVDGLTGTESNTFNGVPYPVARGADFAMPADPGHEFQNVLDQLCGTSTYVPPYPEITRDGFVSSYVQTGGSADPGFRAGKESARIEEAKYARRGGDGVVADLGVYPVLATGRVLERVRSIGEEPEPRPELTRNHMRAEEHTLREHQCQRRKD